MKLAPFYTDIANIYTIMQTASIPGRSASIGVVNDLGWISAENQSLAALDSCRQWTTGSLVPTGARRETESKSSSNTNRRNPQESK